MKILAIGAHADDIELGCGGTLIKAVKKGHSVKMVIMSNSATQNYDGKITRTENEARAEAFLALKILGIGAKNLVILDFPNKDIPYNSSSVEALNRIIDEFSPDIILTHWTFDTHQDHRNTALATISAARNHNNILMYEPFPPSGRSYIAYRPQIYIDISDTILKKVELIKAHKSQLNKYGIDWIESVQGRARLRGFECGKKYSETFELVRYMLDF